jgi:hypothetical protein
MTFSPTECKRLLELRRKATAGEWHFFADDGREAHRDIRVCTTAGEHDDECPDVPHCHKCVCAPFEDHDAAFIAAAPALADQLEAAMGVIERIRAETLEEAARVCEGETVVGFSSDAKAHNASCEHCAVAIRNLLAEGEVA